MQEGKAKMWKLGKITAKTHIGDYGQIVDYLTNKADEKYGK